HTTKTPGKHYIIDSRKLRWHRSYSESPRSEILLFFDDSLDYQEIKDEIKWLKMEQLNKIGENANAMKRQAAIYYFKAGCTAS
ncbi:MAG: hypothetical protein LBM04_02060, partial [Opitutaceae bacterium]|nr:hypothetical protein [Opitutaceae bacterium]